MANFNIDYLVVAGGGAGGVIGGGGGAGGFRTSYGAGNINGGLTTVETPQSLSTDTTYQVTVGSGGVATPTPGNSGPNGQSGSGGDSSFAGATTILSTGGGGGGNYGNGTGASGGSGGGGCSRNSYRAGGSRITIPVQGFNGSSNNSSQPYPSGGGGGAGGAGGIATGGSALSSSITGTPTLMAGGGGGGWQSYYGGSVNTTGGGGGASNGEASNNASDATNNTGSGGGGGGFSSNLYYGQGGNGGSGIVILRYITADVASYTITGAAPTETTDGTNTVLSFTTVGTSSITFTPQPPPPTFDGTKVTTPVTGFESGVDVGLKIPVGTNSNLPTGVEGMIRNDTEENGGGTNSTTAITFYNGTDWKYFTSTESPDVAYPASLKMYLNASDTASYTGTGTTWFDLTDNNNDGTISGATWDPAGYFDFNGISDKINLSGQPFFPTSTTQSNQVKCISAWVQPDATSSNMYIFSVSSTTQTKDYFTFDLVQSSWTGAPALRVRVQNGGSGDRLDVLANITATNAWTHVLAQLGSSGVELYLNGISQSVNYATSGSATNSYWIEDISYATSVDTLIGQYRSTTSGSNSSNSEGRMSKVRIYDSVLTQAEITALHTEGP